MTGPRPVPGPVPEMVAGLAVRRYGRTPPAPVVALFHANGDSGACWPDLVVRWTPVAHLVAVDLRGHGRSPRFSPRQLVEPGDVHVEDTVRVLTELRLPDQPLVAVGHSLGGAALTAACAEHPGLVDALVLIDPPWDTPPVLGHRPEVGAAWVGRVTAYGLDPEGELESMRVREPAWPDVERRAWVGSKAEVDLAYLATGSGRPSTPWTDHVPRLFTPTLVVTGDDDVLIGPDTRAAISAIDNECVEVAVVAGVGHYVRQGDPDAFHAVADPWLRRHLTPVAPVTDTGAGPS